MISLRPYQHRALEGVRAAIVDGQRRILLVAPTGAGKTVIASSMIDSGYRRGTRFLFVAHRRELIEQTVNKLEEIGIPPGEVGVIMGSHPRRLPGAAVQVASVDTLRNRAKPHADVVIIDEAHRSLAKSYRDLVEAYPGAIVVGMTATPYRVDGRGLGSMYGFLEVVAQPQELIDDGFLVAPITFHAERKANLSGVKKSRGDFEEGALSAAMRKLDGDVVAQWIEKGRGQQTVAFAVNVEHSRSLVARFLEAGISAEHIDGETPIEQRSATLARIRSGATRIVVNCGILAEGWDCPPVKTAILARPTLSKSLYLQQAGRILRPYRDLPAIILDHAGNSHRHGLPQWDRECSLEAEPKKRESDAAPIKTCPKCFAALGAAARECDQCGHEFKPEEPEFTGIEEEPIDLVRADETRRTAAEEIDILGKKFAHLVEEGRNRGYKPNAAIAKYKQQVGTWPSAAVKRRGAEYLVTWGYGVAS